jgi:putative selenate reductase FAD-binding subunit
MMTIREYKRAESLEEAWQLNQKRNNRVIGGMIWLKMENINVGTAIDLSGLGLDKIEETAEGFSIGAMVPLRQIELHEGLNAYTEGAVRESVRHIVGVQLRSLATVGGSIYSRFGFSDVLTMFLALNASVELYKGGIVPLSEYAQRPYDRDILVRVIVPKEQAAFCYQSVRNSQTDFPVLTCAAARMETGDYRIVIGARPLRAVRFELPVEPALAAEQLAAQFAEGVKAQIVTGSNMRGSAEYRRHLAGVLTKRAVLELEQRKMQEEK